MVLRPTRQGGSLFGQKREIHFCSPEAEIQKEQQSGLKSGFLENSKGLEKHSETLVQAPQGLQTHPRKSRFGHFEFWSQSGPRK